MAAYSVERVVSPASWQSEEVDKITVVWNWHVVLVEQMSCLLIVHFMRNKIISVHPFLLPFDLLSL